MENQKKQYEIEINPKNPSRIEINTRFVITEKFRKSVRKVKGVDVILFYKNNVTVLFGKMFTAEEVSESLAEEIELYLKHESGIKSCK